MPRGRTTARLREILAVLEASGVDSRMTASNLLGGVEAGGTKFVCAVGNATGEILAETRFPTTSPDETIARAVAFFQEHRSGLAALGVGSFGPVDLDRRSESYGHITSTPKPGWSNVDLRGRLARALELPVAFDTDVNAAALAEHRWGAAQDVSNVLYLTIGTGIGGGALVDGRLLHGLVHPEMGHIRIPRVANDAFAGVCPFHGDCLEGLASGPALERRWGQRAETLPSDHPAWPTLARELGVALANFICTLSPERIIIGGGVSQQASVLPLVRLEVPRALADYVKVSTITRSIDHYIVAPGLGSRAGVLGALALASTGQPTI